MARCLFVVCGISLLVLTPAVLASPVTLVNPNDAWHYHKGTNAAQADWKTAAEANLDTTWLTGNGGFGYADNGSETTNCLTLLTDMSGRYTTVYLRRQFTITNAVPSDAHLYLRMDWDDGYLAWLDGVYLGSVNVTGAPNEPTNSAAASGSHESSLGNSSPQPAGVTDLGLASAWIGTGAHTLAIMGLNQTIDGSDFIHVAELYFDTPPPLVTNVWRAAASPIVLTSSYTVTNNEVLVIEPGVTVELGSAMNLTVADGGRLLAEGTSNAPIRFTRSGATGNWGNVRINGSLRSPETRITHARFEFNANSTSTACVLVSAGTVFLDHLSFGNTGAPYIHVDGASFVISHCYFPACTAEFEPVHGSAGIRSDGHGIFTRNFFGKANDYRDVVDFTGGKRPGPIVHFVENVFAGGDDDGVDLDGTDAWVEGNIFLHFHKNGSTPDSSDGVSGGSNSGRSSNITVVGNLFYDCDQAADAKQGNFYTMINNTIVHQTHQGGVDNEGAVVTLADQGTTQGAGCYLEGNVIQDVEQLTRNVTTALVTFTNNLMPFGWSGPGGGNATNDPMLVKIPQLSETYFTNWSDAQIVRDWFALRPGSPGIHMGPNGVDRGGVIARGVSISGEPAAPTTLNTATLVVGWNRDGSGISTAGWPAGSGYTAYKWRLDGGTWSEETPISSPIALTNLVLGLHFVEVTGRMDSGLYQDDPLFGDAAIVTRSRAWNVIAPPVLQAIWLSPSNGVQLQFTAQANEGYVIEYADSLASNDWKSLVVLDPVPFVHPVEFTDPTSAGKATRFYRLAR